MGLIQKISIVSPSTPYPRYRPGDEGSTETVLSAAATVFVFAQLVFQIAIILSNRGTYFIIKIWREFFHAMNGPSMLQNLFKEFCFCLRTCRESAVGPKIFAAYRLVHVKAPFLNRKITIIFQDSRGLSATRLDSILIMDRRFQFKFYDGRLSISTSHPNPDLGNCHCE
jgi:hypothetical protein